MRLGLGPVFLYDCLAGSRRWTTYAIRSSAVSALLIGMTTIAVSHRAMIDGPSWREYAKLGQSYFYAMIGAELAMVMLAAPAAAAGAICLDRARGTLAHMLATDLSDIEIVLGKLAARLLPVLGLIACSWPVLAIGLLWLTGRTFDRCFGRIPEDPDQAHWLADILLVLAAMVGVGGLYGAIAIRSHGVTTNRFEFEIGAGILCTILAMTIGFVMVSANAAISIAGVRTQVVAGREADTLVFARRRVEARWWESVRLVLFLAIGPTLIALSLATATVRPSEGVDVLGELVPWEPPLAARLAAAVLLFITIVAQGAAATGVNLASGIGLRTRNRAIATSIGLMLLATIGCPILFFLIAEESTIRGMAGMGPVVAMGFLFVHLAARTESLPDVAMTIGIWDAAIFLAAVGLLWWSIKAVERRVGHRDDRDPATALARYRPTADPSHSRS